MKQEIIYGDTDSVFVHLNTDSDPLNIAKELSEEGLEMECEKILKTFFTRMQMVAQVGTQDVVVQVTV